MYGHQLERVLHGVVEARQEVFECVQDGVQGGVVAVTGRRVAQDLFEQQHVARHALHRRQQQRAQVQSVTARVLQPALWQVRTTLSVDDSQHVATFVRVQICLRCNTINRT